MRTGLFFGWLVALAIVGGGGCGGAPVDEAQVGDEQDLKGPSPEEAKACEEGNVAADGTGAKVLHCTKPFATAPAVRLPADAITGDDAQLYGGITVPQTADELTVIWARDGKRYVPVDADGKPVVFSKGGLPRAIHAPTNRITFTLYQFKGKLGGQVDTSFGKSTAIRLSTAREVVMVDGCAFDSRLAGTWSGTVSERLATPQGGGPFAKAFDETKRIPIHLTFDTITKSNPLQEYKGGGARLADEDTYLLEGKIDNFDGDVTVNGKSYPSLAAMGAKNPFLGAKDGKVQLYRLGNMHGQMNDGHWVFTYPQGTTSITLNGMSFTLTALTAPSMLFGTDASAPDLQSVTIKPHIPFTVNGHTLVISPENVGAKIGQCR